MTCREQQDNTGTFGSPFEKWWSLLSLRRLQLEACPDGSRRRAHNTIAETITVTASSSGKTALQMRPGAVKMIHVLLITSFCVVAIVADDCAITNGENNRTFVPSPACA